MEKLFMVCAGDWSKSYWYQALLQPLLHRFLDTMIYSVTGNAELGNVNSFRYRGYYYDVESGFLPIGDTIYILGLFILGAICLVSNESSLPNQGPVSEIPDAPDVDAGKQGKHVPGHSNNNPDKSQWNQGENGVQQTQEAWNNGQIVKPDGSSYKDKEGPGIKIGD